MLRLAIKKIINNKALMISLFSGILIAVLISATIPIYSAGISHRMLVTQLENYQNEFQVSPGAVKISCSLASFKQQLVDENGNSITVDKFDSAANLNNYKFCSEYLENVLYKKMNMPALLTSTTLSTTTLFAGDVRDFSKSNVNKIIIKATDTYENAFILVDGQMPSASITDDGCVEVVISRAMQEKMHYVVGTVLEADYTKEGILEEFSDAPVKLKISGIFDYDENPLNPIVDADSGIEMYADFSLFYNHLFVDKNFASKATWYFAGDYTRFDLDQIEETIAGLEELNKNIFTWGLTGNVSTVTPPIEQYISYFENVQSINVLLAFFYSPILILVVFFIFMISKFVVENDKNEIAMLNSRGASRKQILTLYLIQGGLVTLIGVIIAPLLAVFICRLLGASSGFLEFGQNAPMKINLSASAYVFGILAGALAISTMLVPVFRAAKVEIVQFKRKIKASHIGTVISAVVAAVLGGLAVYAYYVLVYQGEGLLTEKGGIQPLAYVFLISLFASVGLIFTLIYPLFLKLFLLIFGKKSSASTYSAFSRISKLEIKEKFVVIFLTLTIALGVFSSISARTLNGNMQNTIRYRYPCDIIAEVKYYKTSNSEKLNMPYLFEDIEGIDATKITTGNNPRINTSFGNKLTSDIDFMALNPEEFGNIVTWDDSILPLPLKNYLDLLAENPQGCIISPNTAAALGNLKVGDSVLIRPDSSLNGGAVIVSEVLAIVDAWPTYYSTIDVVGGTPKNNFLVVVNSSACDKVAENLPYKVWMNTDKTVSELKQITISKGVEFKTSARLVNIVNGAREVYLGEINPIRQAVNGSLSLGFIAVILICAIGFIIYWAISIKSRTLQIGTMRALGMSFKDVFKMIMLEEGLLCILPLVLGIAAGILSGFLFTPLLQSAFESMGQMPEYKVLFETSDLVKLLVLFAILIAITVVAAIVMLKRIKAASAIKLGEE